MEYAVLRIDSPSYGWIESTHDSVDAARDAMSAARRNVKRAHRDALTHLMYEVAAVTADEIRAGRARRRGV